MANDLDYIGSLLNQYGGYILVAIAIYAAIFIYKNYKTTDKIKPVKRSEIERDNFIKRMSFNDNTYKNLVVNGKPKYRIKKIQASTYEVDKATIKIMEMVLQPLHFRFLPFGKVNGYVFNGDNVKRSETNQNNLDLKLGTTTWLQNGVFMDNSFPKEVITYFKRDYVAFTDFENLSSVYYASAQEQSVIEPNRGHATLSDHLEIENTKEQRRKMQMGL